MEGLEWMVLQDLDADAYEYAVMRAFNYVSL